MTQYEIIKAEGKGDIDITTANKMLEEIGSTVRLVEGKSTITAAELAATVVSDDPAKVTGWGHMAHGIGSPEKMHVKNGKFDYDTGFDRDNHVTLYIKDRKYRVIHDHIEVM